MAAEHDCQTGTLWSCVYVLGNGGGVGIKYHSECVFGVLGAGQGVGQEIAEAGGGEEDGRWTAEVEVYYHYCYGVGGGEGWDGGAGGKETGECGGGYGGYGLEIGGFGVGFGGGGFNLYSLDLVRK